MTKRLIALLIVIATLSGMAAGCKPSQNGTDIEADTGIDSDPILYYSLDEESGSIAKDMVSGENYKINYVFNAENADSLFKEPNDPLRRPGVKGNALYMDGFSNNIVNRDFETPSSAITLSAWVAPRVFENIVQYDGASDAAGHTRMTSILNKGDKIGRAHV